MNSKTLYAILTILFLTSGLSAQTQLAIIKDPKWNVSAAFDSRSGTSLRLSANSMAMIVNLPEADFGVINVDDKLNQKWTSPLLGFPLGIGMFKGQILVIAATDKSFFKNFSGSYKAYLLDQNSGRLMSEKIIYESNPSFVEEPDFFFANDGSYFRMSVRLTSMKRKTQILAVSKSDDDYRLTQGFSIINFDDQLNQKQRITPVFPDGETWTSSNSIDGSLFIAAVKAGSGTINASIYTSIDAAPLKTVSVPLDLRKGFAIRSIRSIAGKNRFVNYLGIIYVNQDKEIALLTVKINFADGTYQSAKEVYESKYVKEIRKSFSPINKKFDDLQFSKLEFLGIRHMEEFGDKLMVSVSPAFTQVGSGGGGHFEGSVLMNIYDQALKPVYHQFIPRTYLSINGEGSEVSYALSSNILRMVANVRTSGFSSVTSLYGEMDLKTGQMLKLNLIPGGDIISGFYINAASVIWFNESCILPYFDRQRVFRTTRDAQVQLLKY
ncbi:MAG: hypothetical protein V4594_09355 [Bacteroidota bacterium]